MVKEALSAHAAKPDPSIARIPMRLRATNRWCHHHDSADEGGADEHFLTTLPNLGKARTPLQGTMICQVWGLVQGVRVMS